MDIGYSLQNVETHINYHLKIKGIDYLGDYYCMFDRHPVFYYCVSSNELHAYAIKKEYFRRCIELYPDLKVKFQNNSFKKYINTIKKPIENYISKNIKVYNQTHSDVKINRKFKLSNV